jgi:hypothetical protein
VGDSSDAVFRVVYDARAAGFTIPVRTLGFYLLFVGICLLYARAGERARDRRLAVVAALAGLILGASAVLGRYNEYRSLVSVLERRQCTIVDGVVEDFVPGRADGHRNERFRVGTRTFEYSPFLRYSGYRTVQPEGGIISPGLRVRICAADSRIARLEVAARGPTAPAS